MIKTKSIKTLHEFESLKAGDFVACEFKRNTWLRDERTDFGIYEIQLVKPEQSEIILQIQNNVYFNYSMFLSKTEVSNLKEITLITRLK